MSEVTKAIKIALEADSNATRKAIVTALLGAFEEVNKATGAGGTAGGTQLAKKLVDKSTIVSEYAAAVREINQKYSGRNSPFAAMTKTLNEGVLKTLKEGMQSINVDLGRMQQRYAEINRSLDDTMRSEEEYQELLSERLKLLAQINTKMNEASSIQQLQDDISGAKGKPGSPFQQALRSMGAAGVAYGIGNLAQTAGHAMPMIYQNMAAGYQSRYMMGSAMMHGDYSGMLAQTMFGEEMSRAGTTAKVSNAVGGAAMGAGTALGLLGLAKTFGMVANPLLGLGFTAASALGSGIWSHYSRGNSAALDAQQSIKGSAMAMLEPANFMRDIWFGMDESNVSARRATGLGMGALGQIGLGGAGLTHSQRRAMQTQIAMGYGEHAADRAAAGRLGVMSTAGIDLGSMLSASSIYRQIGAGGANHTVQMISMAKAMGLANPQTAGFLSLDAQLASGAAGGWGNATGAVGQQFIQDYLMRVSRSQGGKLYGSNVDAAGQTLGALNGMFTANGGMSAIGGFRGIMDFARTSGVNLSASGAAVLQREGLNISNEALADMLGMDTGSAAFRAKRGQLFGSLARGQLETALGYSPGLMERFQGGGFGALGKTERFDLISSFAQSKGLNYEQSRKALELLQGLEGGQISEGSFQKAYGNIMASAGATSQRTRDQVRFESLIGMEVDWQDKDGKTKKTTMGEMFRNMAEALSDEGMKNAITNVSTAFKTMQDQASQLDGKLKDLVDGPNSPMGQFVAHVERWYALAGVEAPKPIKSREKRPEDLPHYENVGG